MSFTINDNGDSVIDENDDCYNLLAVWVDHNHDGKSETEELKTLEETGIISISLKNKKIDIGEKTEDRAEVLICRDGVTKKSYISEFWFNIDSSDTTQDGQITVGNVPSLNNALLNDENGELYNLCNLFGNATDESIKRYYLKKILYMITDSQNIDSRSRGGNIDARDLHVIEAFMGREFIGVGGENPNSPASSILKDIYKNIEDRYYNIVNCHTSVGPYLNMMVYNENDIEVIDFSFINYVLEDKLINNEEVDSIIHSIYEYLTVYDRINNTKYCEKFVEHYEALGIIFKNNYGYTYDVV